MTEESHKHGPRVDDDMKRRVEGHLQASSPGGRAEEWREPAPAAEGEPEVSVEPHPDPQSRSDVELHMTPYEIEERSRFTRYLERGMFPADCRELIRAAKAAGAPDDLVEDLRRLPSHE